MCLQITPLMFIIPPSPTQRDGKMILTHTPSTSKQRQEHRLLVSIRFAVVLHAIRHPNSNPMQSELVQQRLQDLEQHLFFNNATQLFHQQFVGRSGELGHEYSLYVDPRSGKASVTKVSSENINHLALARA